MTSQDKKNLNMLKAELRRFIRDYLTPLKNTLSNDWRRTKELLNKISNDQRKIDLLSREIDRISSNINKIFGE